MQQKGREGCGTGEDGENVGIGEKSACPPFLPPSPPKGSAPTPPCSGSVIYIVGNSFVVEGGRKRKRNHVRCERQGKYKGMYVSKQCIYRRGQTRNGSPGRKGGNVCFERKREREVRRVREETSEI